MLKYLLCSLSFVFYCSSDPVWGSASTQEDIRETEKRPHHSIQNVAGIEVDRYHYGDILSTQKAAKNHQEALDLTHWSLTTADRQLGILRYKGREWSFLEGNVFATYSLPFLPEFQSRTFLLPPTVTLAIVDTLVALGIKEEAIDLRWVNKVLVEGEKAAGCFMSSDGQILQICIGFNLDLPVETLTECLVVKLKAFLDETYNPIDDYRKKLLDIGEEVTVFEEGNSLNGIFLGIDDQGFLLLEKDGETKKCVTGALSPKSKVSA